MDRKANTNVISADMLSKEIRQLYESDEHEYLIATLSRPSSVHMPNNIVIITDLAGYKNLDTGKTIAKFAQAYSYYPISKDIDTFNLYLEKNTIYMVRGCRSKEFGDTSILITEILEENVVDKELKRLINHFEIDEVVHTRTFGNMVYNKYIKMLSCDIPWSIRPNSIKVSVCIKNAPSECDFEPVLKEMKALLDDKATLIKRLEEALLKDLYSSACAWCESSDISENELLDIVELKEIRYLPNINLMYAYFDDGDIFGGHIISVQIDLKTNEMHSSIDG